jgi:hypothetical protein
MILKPLRPLYQRSGDPLKTKFEEGAIVDFEQPVGDLNSVIGVDTDLMGVEGRVMQLRQR